MQSARRVIMGVLLLSTTLNVFAQIQPAPSTPLPSQLPAGMTRPGQVPAGTQVPGNTPGRTQQPGATQQQGGRTQQQGATQQQGGRTQQQGTSQQGNNQQGGRTQIQADQNQGEGPTDATDATEKAKERRSNADDPDAGDNIEDEAEQLRRQELNRIRRKLFGFEVFNNPDYQNQFQPNLRIATPAGYVLGPDDQLNVNVYGYSEADYKLVVNPDGFVYIEKVGPVHVAGLTVDQAKNRLRDRMSKIYVGLKSSAYGAANTYLVVTLGNIRSIRISVLGEAGKPGTYTLSSLSTALNAIYEAGGPNGIGSYRNIQLIRNNRVVTTIDLYDFLTTGVQRNNLRLQDNDVIRFNTYRLRTEISGPLKRNNIFELIPGESLQRLIDLAGGFTSNAYRHRIKVTRFTEKELKVIDVTADQFSSFQLRDGDNVVVEQVLNRYENQVTITGAVFRPGTYSLDQNKTLRQLLQSAEGLRGDAFAGRIQIVRTREDMAVENISLNLANIINGVDPDVELRREDQIQIPSRFEMAEFANVKISGEVNKQIQEVPYTANMTLEDLLIQAGGMREAAAAAQVEIVRRKKDVDPTSTTAQIAEVYRIDVGRDLSIRPNDSKFILEPYDEVIVRRSPNYREQSYTTAEGELVMPGLHPLRSKDQRISDLIKQAGGLTPYAYIEGATLVRTVQKSQAEAQMQQKAISELADDSRKAVVDVEVPSAVREEAIGINLRRILERPGSAEDMLLQANDILRIPKRLETVRVGGEVLLPTTVKYRTGQSFQDYISQAGGFTNRSARKRAYVVYANGSADRTRKFAFFNIYPRVEPGAEIIIPQKTTGELTPQQALREATGIASSVMTLILTILAFRSLR